MTPVSIVRLKRSLAAVAAPLAVLAAPVLAEDAPARVPGNKFVVVNQTQAPLTCRYRVNSIASGGGGGAWQDSSPIAAGAEFSRTAQAPGESLSLACSAEGTRNAVTLQPGQRYVASKLDDGKVVVTRERA